MNCKSYEYYLARLYTDQSFRIRFFSEKEKVLAELSVDDQIKKLLSKLKEEEVEFFAKGLINKRYGVVKSFFPLSAHYLGENFRKKFQEYAANHSVKGLHLKHVNDAVKFSGIYLNNASFTEDWHKDLVKYEQFIAKTLKPECSFHLQFLKFPVHQIRIEDMVKVKKKLSWILFIRFKGRRKFISFSLG